jgi:hypothetical protein
MRTWLAFFGAALSASTAAAQFGERPAILERTEQAQIESGALGFEEIFERGRMLFDARFNRLDGQGRPATTGTGAPRNADQPPFIRTSGPDATSCTGCHAQPRIGGAGDFVANVFVLAQALDPVTDSVDPNFSNERNTPGMMGAGPIEMLAREMSTELIAIREEARRAATETGQPASRRLVAKGVEFGRITVLPDGRIDPSEIEGVDWDLIVKPFHQKGAVVSLRQFSNNAMNHHHGIQSVERFGLDTDPDGDGVTNELTIGEITAVTIFKAALNTPGRCIPPEYADDIEAGERIFAAIGCTTCHVPAMTLKSRFFNEPNPFNPGGNIDPPFGNLQLADVAKPFSFDMTRQGPAPRLEPGPNGSAVVRAFTDLKRHNLNDEQLRHFANERVPQGRLNGFAPASDFTIPPPPRPLEEFLTRKLWDVGNTAPFGHRGDLTTLTEAIYYHGGAARASRDAFFSLAPVDQDRIIAFLKSMQVLEDGSPMHVAGDAAFNPLASNKIEFDPDQIFRCGPIGLLPLGLLTCALLAARVRRPSFRR